MAAVGGRTKREKIKSQSNDSCLSSLSLRVIFHRSNSSRIIQDGTSVQPGVGKNVWKKGNAYSDGWSRRCWKGEMTASGRKIMSFSPSAHVHFSFVIFLMQ